LLNALSISLAADPIGASRAEVSLARQGFSASSSFTWRDVVVRGWVADPTSDASKSSVSSGIDGYGCCVGTLWYRGRFGSEALALLLAELSSCRAGDRGTSGVQDAVDARELRGSFVAVLFNRESAWLLADPLGLVQVYGSADRRFYSTSWLAAAAYDDDQRLDEDASIEYVLLGAAHSESTPARAVHRVPQGTAVDLVRRSPVRWIPSSAWDAAGPPADAEEAVDSIVAHLSRVFREVAAAFPSRTRAALSGGFDSRSIVAGLLAVGERPELFVYGNPESDDVRIASRIAAACELELSVFDKEQMNSEFRPLELENLVESAFFFDGLPNDGVIDPGADRMTRRQQSASGYIALNGGGGEVLRNFFHLADGDFAPRDIVLAFYRAFDSAVLRRAAALDRYQERLAASISNAVGGSDSKGKLSRRQVELAYPLFRCRYWMGTNNSVALRTGAFSTPLVDLQLVRLSCGLPLAWKNAGALQSRIVSALHSPIAAHLSSYGFRFSEGPGLRARFADFLSRVRPVRARPLINAARRFLSSSRVKPEVVSRFRSILPGDWQLDAALDARRLGDDAAFSRLLSVELFARGLLR